MLFHVVSQIKAPKDDQVNEAQVCLKILTQVCEGDAHHILNEAKEVALDKLTEVNGKVSIFEWNEEAMESYKELMVLWNEANKEELHKEQKYRILYAVRTEEGLIRTHLKEIKNKDKGYVGQEDTLEKVDNYLLALCTETYEAIV